MEYKKLLNLYIPLIDFIADIIGSQCEVILHNIVDIKNSVIAIRNGYISGRHVGCSLTDLEFKLLKNKACLNQNTLVNYRSITDNDENLITSAYYIKDTREEVIGMICVHILNSPDRPINRTSTESLLSALSSETYLTTSLDHVVDDALKNLIAKYNISVERMSIEEKKEIIQELCAKKIFKIKGAVTKVATTFKTSESTIYRYLSMK